MKGIIELYLFPVIVMLSFLNYNESLGPLLDCDMEKIRIPYIKVHKDLDGGVMDSLSGTGFLSLKSYRDSVLCINGAALVYDGYNYTSGFFYMENPTVTVYSHKCFKINQLSKQEKMTQTANKNEEEDHEENDGKQFVGEKVTGVLLIGELQDYSAAILYWLPSKDLRYYEKMKEKFDEGASFVIIGADNYCAKLNNYSFNFRNKIPSNDYVCSQTVTSSDYPLIGSFFESGFSVKDFEIVDCQETARTSDEFLRSLQINPVYRYDPFSMINPEKLTLRGSGFVARRNKSIIPEAISGSCDEDKGNCQIGSTFGDAESDIYSLSTKDKKKPVKQFLIQNCNPMPTPSCKEDHSKKKVNACKIFLSVLALDDDEEEHTDPSIQWRMEVLDQINYIYSLICPMYSHDDTSTVKRLFRYYLTEASRSDENARRTIKASVEMPNVWIYLTDELKRCRNNAMPIQFDWKIKQETEEAAKNNDTVEGPNDEADAPNISTEFDYKDEEKNQRFKRYSKFLQGSRRHEAVMVQEVIPDTTDELDTKYTGVPVNIRIVDPHKDIFFFDEAGDTVYEFNKAIDLEWKIFGTVIGYCNSFYTARKSETFPRLLNTFYEDFLDPIIDDWTSPQDNEIVSTFLSNILTDSKSRWVDACFEASYIVSDCITFRPPRPLMLTNGSGHGAELNYFLKQPEFKAE